MSTTTPVPTVPKVRTYASDLDATRGKHGLAVPPPQSLPKKVTAPFVQKLVPKITKSVAPMSPRPTITVPTPAAPKPTVAVPPVPPAVIPPFHTFKKSAVPQGEKPIIDTSEFTASLSKAKPSVLATPGVEQLTVNKHDIDGATIITDTKHKRFSLFGELAASLEGWWGEKQKALRQRNIPKYTVPEAERRKGVIQKATTQTGRTSTADHEAVVNRIKSAQKTVRRSGREQEVAAPTHSTTTIITPIPPTPPTFAEPFAEVPETTPVTVIEIEPFVQVPLTTTTNTLIESMPAVETIPVPATEIVSTKTIAEKLEELEQLQDSVVVGAKVPVPLVAPITPPVIPQAITPAAQPRITPIIPVIATTESPVAPVIATIPKPISEEPATETIDREVEEMTLRMEATPSSKKPNWSQLVLPKIKSDSWWKNGNVLRELFTRTNHIALGLTAGIGLVLVLWFGGQALLNLRAGTASVDSSTSNTMFTDSTFGIVATVPKTKAELLSAVQALQANTDSFTELAYAGPTSTTPFTATEFFSLLGASVNAEFAASITRIGFGNYHNGPWIAFDSDNPVAIQGGMLVWEKNLDADVSSWFTTTPLRTTKKGITLFHDEVIATHDVRILSDSDGKERVVYGFISPHRLVIANNSTTFLNLAEKSARAE